MSSSNQTSWTQVLDLCMNYFLFYMYVNSDEYFMICFFFPPDRNPSPPAPDELEIDPEILHADTIGDTVFSKRWVFATLMKLLKVRKVQGPISQNLAQLRKCTCATFYGAAYATKCEMLGSYAIFW